MTRCLIEDVVSLGACNMTRFDNKSKILVEAIRGSKTLSSTSKAVVR